MPALSPIHRSVLLIAGTWTSLALATGAHAATPSPRIARAIAPAIALVRDLDRDGAPDRITLERSATIVTVRMAGQPSAVRYALAAPARALEAVDRNGDGHLDLVATFEAGETVLRGDGRGGFAASAAPEGTLAPVIVVTKTDTLVTDVDGDLVVDPGDTIEYRIGIQNTGTASATDVQMSDTIDPSTTLDGAANVSPLAFDDAYTTIGNTLLEVSAAPSAAPAVYVAGSVLANDVEFLGDTFTLSAFDAISVQGGTVAMNNDGTFTYLPAVGFTGADQFQYTIADGGGLTGTGVVSITVSERVWYVNNAAAPGGDGRSTSPLDALTSLNGAGGAGDPDGNGDYLYLYAGSGAYTGGIELETGQRLIGQGVALVVDPGTGPVALVPAGSPPTVDRTGGTAVLLASGNTVRGLGVTSNGGAGVVGTAAGALTMNSLTIASTGGLALRLEGGALDVVLASVSATNLAGGGVLLQNNTGAIAFQSLAVTNTGGAGFLAANSGTVTVTGAANTIVTTTGVALGMSGTTIGAAGLTFQTVSSTGGASGISLASTGALAGLTVTGTGAANSGGILTGATGDAIALSGVRSVSLTDVQVTGSAGNHIDASTLSHGISLTRFFGDQSGSDGVRLVNVLGASSITSSTITRSAGLNLHVQNATATVASPGAPDVFTIAGSTITNTLASLLGSSGIRFEGLTGGNLRLVLGTSTVTNNRVDGLEVKAQNGSRVDVRVSGTAFTGNLGSAINVSSANTATAIADIRNLTGLSSALNAVNFINFDTSTMNVTVDNVQIVGSTSGNGIRVIQEGNGTVLARLVNNNISGIAQAHGIVAQARAGNGSLSLSVSSNTVNNTASGILVLEGMNFESGSSAGGDANTICLDLANNNSTVSAISGQEGYRLRQRAGTTFNLQNFAGNGAIAADVTSWVNATKSNAGTTQILIGTAFTNAPAACPLPPALPAVVAAELEAAPVASLAPERDPSAPEVIRLASTGSARASAALATEAIAADVPVTIGTLPNGKGVQVVFRVAVNSVIAGGAKMVSNQATVSGTNFTAVLSDDPDAPGAADPTVTPIDDTLLPQVQVVAPNGGETWLVAGTYKIEWTAIDNQGVTVVDLRLSRDNGATWEDIAVGIANSGTYDWVVTPPPANVDENPVFAALIEVRAHDGNGNVGTDASDAPFAIFDMALETLLSLFEAAPVPNGIELRWSVASDRVAVSGVERATSAEGPWSAVAATSRSEANATVVVDTDVVPGRTYWYRIAGRDVDGRSMTFGPLRVTAGAPVEFALNSVGPNPSSGPVKIDLSLAKRGAIRVSIIDLQGRELVTLLDGVREAGRYQAVWSGATDRGPAPAGVYFVRYGSPGGTFVRRIVLAR